MAVEEPSVVENGARASRRGPWFHAPVSACRATIKETPRFGGMKERPLKLKPKGSRFSALSNLKDDEIDGDSEDFNDYDSHVADAQVNSSTQITLPFTRLDTNRPGPSCAPSQNNGPGKFNVHDAGTSQPNPTSLPKPHDTLVDPSPLQVTPMTQLQNDYVGDPQHVNSHDTLHQCVNSHDNRNRNPSLIPKSWPDRMNVGHSEELALATVLESRRGKLSKASSDMALFGKYDREKLRMPVKGRVFEQLSLAKKKVVLLRRDDESLNAVSGKDTSEPDHDTSNVEIAP